MKTEPNSIYIKTSHTYQFECNNYFEILIGATLNPTLSTKVRMYETN